EDVGISSDRLSPFSSVRQGLARLALAKDPGLAPKLWESDDIAYRCAVYRHTRLSAEQIEEAQARDGHIALNELLENEHLWRTAQLRSALSAASGDAPDENHDLDAPNAYRSMQKRWQHAHPEWFRDEEDDDVETSSQSTSQAATQEDVARMQESVANTFNLV